MIFLKQSTGSDIKIGPFVDSVDGVTPETALTINAADIKLSKNGATMGSKNSGGGTHDANGWYTITLDTTDTNTVGRLQLSCYVTGALPVFLDFMVLEEEVYDMWYASGLTAGVMIARSAGEIIPGTVDTVTNGHTPTATEFQADDITQSITNHYKDRGIIFTSGTLIHQFALITAYSQVGGIGQFTVDGFTGAPANNDTFIII